jgi:uncharacterized protein (TIGR00369 family)
MPQGNIQAPGIAAAQAALAKLAGTGTPDYEQIRKTVDSIVPFVNLAGIRITELRNGFAVAEVPAKADKLNHLGTVHAGALFLAGEVACAGAFSGAIAPRILHVRTFVLRDCRVSFIKPAKGRIRARGTVESPVLADVVKRTTEEQFELAGKALLYDDNDTLVGKMEFDYLCWLGGR